MTDKIVLLNVAAIDAAVAKVTCPDAKRRAWKLRASLREVRPGWLGVPPEKLAAVQGVLRGEALPSPERIALEKAVRKFRVMLKGGRR